MAYTTIDVGNGTKLTFDGNEGKDDWFVVFIIVILAVFVGLFVLMM